MNIGQLDKGICPDLVVSLLTMHMQTLKHDVRKSPYITQYEFKPSLPSPEPPTFMAMINWPRAWIKMTATHDGSIIVAVKRLGWERYASAKRMKSSNGRQRTLKISGQFHPFYRRALAVRGVNDCVRYCWQRRCTSSTGRSPGKHAEESLSKV